MIKHLYKKGLMCRISMNDKEGWIENAQSSKMVL